MGASLSSGALELSDGTLSRLPLMQGVDETALHLLWGMSASGRSDASSFGSSRVPLRRTIMMGCQPSAAFGPSCTGSWAGQVDGPLEVGGVCRWMCLVPYTATERLHV